MRYLQSLIKTFKETPREADNISSALLLRGGYIDQETSGIYSLLPLGWKVLQKISKIIREEMDSIGGMEILMPAMQPRELWEETGRWDNMDPPLFKFKDRHQKDFALGATHEEVIVDLLRDRISSYKELPLMLYQIQVKFRNEQRSAGGLLRTREFLMKDAYSFHRSEEDLEDYYQKVIAAYHKIFKRSGVEARMVESHAGSIGGKRSNEFMLLSETGENKIYMCEACDWAVNLEVTKDVKTCPLCGGEIIQANAIEVAHIFYLGDLYSKKMQATFTDKEGYEKPFMMGCYGIGVPRLMAAIIEANHDEKGIIWPKTIAPFQAYLVDLAGKSGNDIYNKLQKEGIEVLFDDRDMAAGVKFADADLLGIPNRLVISEKTGDKIEVKYRDSDKPRLETLDKIIAELRQ